MEEQLWKTLQKLENEEFATFKWFLKQKVLGSFSGIPVAQLQKADREKTVDLMVQKYQDSGALEVTLLVLGKVSRNDLVKDLLEETKLFKGKSGRQVLQELMRRKIKWSKVLNQKPDDRPAAIRRF